jgi:hypothetical protein
MRLLPSINHHNSGNAEPRKIDTSTVVPAATMAPPMNEKKIDPRETIIFMSTSNNS